MSDKNRALYGKTAMLNFGNAGVAKNLFTLPKNARILFFLVDVDTAFNSSGTDLLDLGKAGSAEFWAADIDLSAVGQTVVMQNNLGDIGSSPLVVQGLYTQSVADATTGLAYITCVYSHYRNR